MKISATIFPYASNIITEEDVSNVIEGTGLTLHPTIPPSFCGQAGVWHFIDRSNQPPEKIKKYGGIYLDQKPR